MRLFYYCDIDGNFGDELSPVIVGRISKKRIAIVNGRTIERKRNKENCFFSLGSIFHYVKDGDVIWGTGINPKRKNPSVLRKLDIRAVRGPLTRQFIQSHYDISCPEIYGDPAMLCKRLFPEHKLTPIRTYGIIPHLRDIKLLNIHDNKVCLPTQGLENVINFILGCELIVSSSLHGIIVAESFGIPARWLRDERFPSFHTEGIFKFNDYYASTNRSLNDWASDLDTAIKIKGKEPVRKFSYESLIKAFPHDVFSMKSRLLSNYEYILDILNSFVNRLQRRFQK
jgi:pyruvyltransferase